MSTSNIEDDAVGVAWELSLSGVCGRHPATGEVVPENWTGG